MFAHLPLATIWLIDFFLSLVIFPLNLNLGIATLPNYDIGHMTVQKNAVIFKKWLNELIRKIKKRYTGYFDFFHKRIDPW